MSGGNGVAEEIDLDIPTDAMRKVAADQRLQGIERRLAELNTAFGQLRAYTLGLSNQQDMTVIQMERNARASAADLAIKSAPEASKGDADMLTALASAWLAWLKGGEQG